MSEATVLRYERLADRQSTFAVWIAHANASFVLIGYVRLDDQIRWVARTLGSASQAADIRRFRDRHAASVWLQKAVDGVHPRRPRIAA
ncbi:MAG: hypothetical protein ABSC06_35410 [Rhodopila sp.]|jgi:hypothetical protein